MKYVALLRGINVGGNNLIKMVALKACLEDEGFKNVITYIQSGNVIFEPLRHPLAGGADDKEKNIEKLTLEIESLLSKTFNYKSRIVLRSYPQMKKVVTEVPNDWEKRADLRCNVAFIKEPMTAREVAKEIIIKEGIDFLEVGEGVLYISTLLSALTKSGLPKVAGKKIYKEMKIRNYNTVKKILKLMEQE